VVGDGRSLARGAIGLATLALGLVGCGLDTMSSVSGSSCDNISGGACTEQVDLLSARHPGATTIDLRCAVPVCDRRTGRGTAVVTMPDGRQVNDSFAYVGDPNPLPAPTCTGLAFDICRNIATSQADTVAPSRRIVAIDVACTAASCTGSDGEATATVTLADGSQEQGGNAWSGGPP
jgi:hypothetical protein